MKYITPRLVELTLQEADAKEFFEVDLDLGATIKQAVITTMTTEPYNKLTCDFYMWLKQGWSLDD